MKILIKEDELWLTLREHEKEMGEFIRLVMENDAADIEYDLDLINDCFKVCIAKIISEEDKWEPKHHTFNEFLETLYGMTVGRGVPDENGIEDIRKEIWGHIFANKNLLLEMAKDYTTEEEIKETQEYKEEKTMMLIMCVFIAYLEISLRKLEFSRMEFFDENNY